MLFDSFYRPITYLRISVTDLCNLRCRYCMPESGINKLNHSDILSYEEILRVAAAAGSEDMAKIRLTGGEPLIRKGLLKFIGLLSEVPGIMDLRLTTNGVLLSEMAADLYAAGIRRVNISLDSINRDTYRFMAGRDELDRVMSGITAALEAGFDRVKVNCVAVRGMNNHELLDMARLCMDRPIEVRFIEFMPLGREGFWSSDKLISTEEIKQLLAPLGKMTPLSNGRTEGPAQVFRLEQAQGTIGFISPVTEHFCATCNRLRLTADGKLRLCLLSNLEIDIKGPLRQGASREELASILKRAVALKPSNHFLDRDLTVGSDRSMNLIGG